MGWRYHFASFVIALAILLVGLIFSIAGYYMKEADPRGNIEMTKELPEGLMWMGIAIVFFTFIYLIRKSIILIF
jgi:hypothetical protein